MQTFKGETLTTKSIIVDALDAADPESRAGILNNDRTVWSDSEASAEQRYRRADNREPDGKSHRQAGSSCPRDVPRIRESWPLI